jgi:hypothetical protein
MHSDMKRYLVTPCKSDMLLRNYVIMVMTAAVLGIRIRRIRMFLGLPDPDQLVRGKDPDPDPDPSLFS